MTKRISVTARQRVSILAGLALVTLMLTGCKTTPTYVYEAEIKKSSVVCTFRGNYTGMQKPASVYFDCLADHTGDNEHPYINLWLDGCTLRVNALEGEPSHWSNTLECNGDGIYEVGLQLCQTHGGPLPDDCLGKSTQAMPNRPA